MLGRRRGGGIARGAGAPGWIAEQIADMSSSSGQLRRAPYGARKNVRDLRSQSASTEY